MLSIRRTGWAALTLAALAAGGCSSEPTDSSPATNVPAVEPGGAPETPPSKAPSETQVMPPGYPKPDTSAPAPTPGATPTDAPPPKVEGPATEPAKGGEPKAAAAVKLTNDEVAEIKKLPAGDQDLALKQAVCPVGEGHLGEMGAPVKVTVEGRTVFLCCDGCVDKIKKDPKGYLAKLPK